MRMGHQNSKKYKANFNDDFDFAEDITKVIFANSIFVLQIPLPNIMQETHGV